MIRTQIQLTEEQARELRAIARDEGLSLAEVIRRCIDNALAVHTCDRAERYNKARCLIGRFTDTSGVSDLGVAHDRYLGESYE